MACTPSVPKEVIQPGDMEDILYDYHIAQAMAKSENSGEDGNFGRSMCFHAVLKKYGITEAEFDSSLVYYYSHLDRLKKIYLEVNERLSDEAKSIGAAVGEIGRYSQLSTSGDTANIWTGISDLLLIPRPTMNRFDFTVQVDTSFHKGDSFMFQFMSEYIWQTGSKDAVVCILTKYEGDSIIQTINHVSVSGISQIRVPANRENKLKEIHGFIYLGTGNDVDMNTRKLMFISQIQLIRFHNKDLPEDETAKTNQMETGSLKRINNSARPMPDTTRNRTLGRMPVKTLPTPSGDIQHRVVSRPDNPKKR